MATFDEESRQTAQKLSDVVLEYTAQFVAEDYLEEYSRVQRKRRPLAVPKELDDRLDQVIDQMERIQRKQKQKQVIGQRTRTVILAAGCVAIVALGFVLSVGGVRDALMVYFGLQ